MIRTVIVSSVRLYRDGLAKLLSGNGRIEVVGCTGFGGRAVERARSLEPDVVLVDVAYAEGQDELRRFVEGVPNAGVLALTVAEADAEIVACAEAGASGVITQASSLEELVEAVENFAGGAVTLSPLVSSVLLRRLQMLARSSERTGPVERLTAREREILELVCDGLSNKEIAARLSIQLATVKNHVHSILEKLAVHRRADAAALLGSIRGVGGRQRSV